MIISGHFSDYHNNKIYLTICSANGSDTYEIGDTLNNNIHFVFDGKKPITIKHDCKDLFEPIIKTTCKIKLRSNIWCGDILFSQGMGDIIVKVERQLKDTQTPVTLFVGFVKPLSFNQDINNQHNVIDINCVDLLEFLDDRYLSTGLQSGQDSTAWKTAIANSAYRPFINIFKKIGLYDYEFAFSGGSEYTTLLIDNNGKDTMANTFQLSDNLWLGESVDDEMSMKDIMMELLKYMNCRIASKNGLEFYIINNQNIATTEQYKAYSHGSPAEVTFEDASTLPKADIAKEQVTMDDCYNMIGVKCELETVDDVIDAPFEKEQLQSKFLNQQKYMTEYVCTDTESADSQLAFLTSILVNGPTDTGNIDSSKIWVRDWYMRIMHNDNWTLNNNYTPSTQDGTYIKQYEALLKMDDLYQRATKGNPYDYITSSTPMYLNPFIINYGKGNNRTLYTPEEKSNIELKPMIVIPCPDTWLYGWNNQTTQITEEQAFNYINTQLVKYENEPMIRYTGTTNVNYKPNSPDIINYIIIGGKIKLVPGCYKKAATPIGESFEYKNLSAEESRTHLVYQNFGSFFDMSIEPCIGSSKNDKRWYYQAFWTRTNPASGTMCSACDPNDPWTEDLWFNKYLEKDPDAPLVRNGRMFFIDTEDMYQKQYGWGKTKVDKRNSKIITLPFVNILQCRLQIGDKYLNETTPNNSTVQTFEWTTDSTATFTLCVRPHSVDDGQEPTDFLIGQEYPIMNNISPDMNLGKDAGEGTAIPITYNDNVSGNIKFDIIAPFNGCINATNHYYKHGTWFRDPETYDSNFNICLLNHVHSINISEFSMKAASNNAKNSTLNSGDLLYYSEDDKKYNNPKDNIDFKIVTALTPEEGAKMNIATGVSFNNPTISNGDVYTSAYNNKPEVQYVNTMWRHYSTPKKIVEYECNYGSTDMGEMVRSVYDCDIMTHLGVPSFKTIMLSSELNLKTDRQKISLREHKLNNVN